MGVSEWKRLLGDLHSKLGSDPHLKSCHRVLSEGYFDLPHHLKSCLLYFGLFPEGYSITCGRLIRLWIAEGFVQCNKYSYEQVAEDYLFQLIDRSLVQLSEGGVSQRARRCRVHDLMHEIILRKTEELGFCRVLNREDLSYSTKTRRISAYKSTNFFLEDIKDSKIRSVFILDIDKWADAFMTAFIVNFRLLKVLDFEDAPVDYLPEGVGNLFHLHYLSVKNTKVKVVPKSISKLFNLETLDLRYSFVTNLPIGIRNLKKLRNLLVYQWDNKSFNKYPAKIQEGFGSLQDLRKLHFVQVDSCFLQELKKLRHLRSLGISVKSNGDVKDVFASIRSMENLERLSLHSTSEEEILDIGSMVSPPQSLTSFSFRGNIKKLPDWIFGLKNLIRIWISLGGSIIDPLRILQALPNLLRLYLVGKDCDEQLHFEEGWFRNLQRLRLQGLGELKLMMIDKGAMPNLRDLRFGPCPLLKEIPTGIEYLGNLKCLLFIDMLKEIYYMIKNDYWKKTEHIPEVGVTYYRAYKDYQYYTSKYVSSLSPQDFEQIIEDKQGRSEEQSLP